MSEKKREQVAKQCEAVIHMARALAEVTDHKPAMFRAGRLDELLDLIGNATAYQMEVLGEILNGMDANDEEEDAWLDPVFKEAHRLWPQQPNR